MNLFKVYFTNESYLQITAWSAAALLAFGVIYWIFLRLRLRRKPFSLSFLFMKVLALSLLGLALAEPFLKDEHVSSNITVLLDVSESNEAGVVDGLLARARAFAPDGTRVQLSSFAGTLGEVLDPSELNSSYSKLREQGGKLDIGATNLEVALEGMFSQGAGSIILISDGYETKGDIKNLLPTLKSQGSKIFPLLPEDLGQTQDVFKISNLHVPLTAPSEKSVPIKVSVLNSSDSAQGGTVEIKHDGNVVLTKRVDVKPGGEELVVAESDPSKEGIKEITALLKPDTRGYAPSSRTAYLSGESREKILIISGLRDDYRFLGRLLESQSYQVQSIISGDGRVEFPDLKQFSVVVLNNVALKNLPRNAPSEIESYVQQGGGFMMVGGDRSFGLGGYKDTAIEDVLPVNLVPPQTVEKRVNVAMEMVIDKSRSMDAGRRLEYAKEAALEVIRNLKDEDYVGVVGFDENPFVVIRMGRVGEIAVDAARRIGLLFPKGGTRLIGAIDEARRDLIRAKAGRKHMLILTDGEVTDAPRTYYYELVRQARQLGITVSTVMVGGEGDESMLREMANLGGGAFYATDDPRSLPKVFISDVKVASGEQTIQEENNFGVRIGPDDLQSTDVATYPRLRGYVKTKSKPKARLELEVFGTQRVDPLLASWDYGKGRSVAFSSDVNGRWSDAWIEWPKLQKFWSDLIDSMRSGENDQKEQTRFDLVQYVEQGSLHLDLTVYSDVSGGRVQAEVVLPDSTKSNIDFESVVKGRYHALVRDPKPGKYELHGKVGNSSLTPVAFHLSGELFGERKGQGFNLPLLSQLADISGGKLNPSPSEVKGQEYKQIEQSDLSIYFILSALILVLLEILMREAGLFARLFRRRQPAKVSAVV